MLFAENARFANAVGLLREVLNLRFDAYDHIWEFSHILISQMSKTPVPEFC